MRAGERAARASEYTVRWRACVCNGSLSRAPAAAAAHPEIKITSGMASSIVVCSTGLSGSERRLLEEARLEELRRKQEEHRRVQEALQRCRACPMGFSWYQCGGGWRCTGGSHFMSDDQLRSWNE